MRHNLYGKHNQHRLFQTVAFEMMWYVHRGFAPLSIDRHSASSPLLFRGTCP